MVLAVLECSLEAIESLEEQNMSRYTITIEPGALTSALRSEVSASASGFSPSATTTPM